MLNTPDLVPVSIYQDPVLLVEEGVDIVADPGFVVWKALWKAL